MNILQGIRPSSTAKGQPNSTTSTKFIIKSKPSVKQNKPAQSETQPNSNYYATNQDVHQLITYIIAKSKRLSQLLQTKGITDSNVTQFHNKNLYQNPCVRTYLKSIMDKMLAERRLGRGLKGINRGILTEIQGMIWGTMEREVSLYQLDKMYENEKKLLENQISTRRKQIQKQIQLLKSQQFDPLSQVQQNQTM